MIVAISVWRLRLTGVDYGVMKKILFPTFLSPPKQPNKRLSPSPCPAGLDPASHPVKVGTQRVALKRLQNSQRKNNIYFSYLSQSYYLCPRIEIYTFHVS